MPAEAQSRADQRIHNPKHSGRGRLRSIGRGHMAGRLGKLHASSVTAVFSAKCKESEGDVLFVTYPDFMYELNPGPHLLGLRA